MRVADKRRAFFKAFVLLSAGTVLSLFALFIATSSTETAVANGDTRTLHLYHTHTGESIDATFRVDGHYDPAVLRQLNHFLRDWRNNDEINMDPRLFDTLWEVYRTAGATQPIQIYSAYRSPQTNAMLRRRSKAVAEHSQHMLGKAIDTTIPGFPMERVREIGMKLQHGGVGWYPSANFVHLDVGGVRSWPRMPYDQLSRLFPDGKTVHIASNGEVLPGYEAARAEIAAHGGTEVPPAQESQGFFAWLFGGTAGAAKEDEEDRSTAVAAASQAAPQPQQAMAYAEPASAPQAGASAAIDGERRDAQETQTRSDQVAALETPAAPDNQGARLDEVFPLPPRRPADLMAMQVIPLPPSRPSTLLRIQSAPVRVADASPSRIDERADMRASSAQQRKAQLPAIITKGSGAWLPGVALAFADPMVDQNGKIAGRRPVATPSEFAKSVGLRSALRGLHTPASTNHPQTMVAAVGAPIGVGAQLTGLRRAARLMTQKASL